MQSRLTPTVVTLSSAILALTLLIGCGGSGGEGEDNGGGEHGYHFSESTLACGESLDITLDSEKPFSTGSVVTFKMGSTELNGSGVLIENNTVLDCGFPSGAPKGNYEVLVNGQEAGNVSNVCSPN